MTKSSEKLVEINHLKNISKWERVFYMRSMTSVFILTKVRRSVS